MEGIYWMNLRVGLFHAERVELAHHEDVRRVRKWCQRGHTSGKVTEMKLEG
jgi:hypothetical protein